MAEQSFDSILVTDAAGIIVFANNAFRTLTGYSPEEVMGKNPKLLQGAATDPRVIERLVTSMRDGTQFEGKAINYKKDGTPFIMHWRVAPVRVGGETPFWLAVQKESNTV